MKSILKFFGLCKRSEVERELKSKIISLEDQVKNLEKFEEIAKKYADFSYTWYGFDGSPEKKDVTKNTSTYIVKNIRTIDDTIKEMKKLELYIILLENSFKYPYVKTEIEAIRETYKKLLEVRCNENKSDS